MKNFLIGLIAGIILVSCKITIDNEVVYDGSADLCRSRAKDYP